MAVTGLDELELTRGLDSDDVEADSLDTVGLRSLGALTTGGNKDGFVAGAAGTIKGVRFKVGTAPTDASLIIDIHKNGTTIFTTQANRPTIAATETASTTTLPDVTSVAAGDLFTLEIDQIGSSVAGSNLFGSITMDHDLVP